MKILELNLQKRWFDMIDEDVKPEEYRKIKEFYMPRFIEYTEEMEWQWIEELMCDLRSPERRHKDIDECLRYFSAKLRKYDAVRLKNGWARPGSAKKVKGGELRNVIPAPERLRKIKNIKIDTGNPEWGAVEGEFYFVVEFGEIIKIEVKDDK